MEATTAPSIETRLPLLAAAIGAHIPGAQVRLFGSSARGNASSVSDIDLLITVPDIWLAPGLSVMALVLFVLFATLVAGAVWPVQLLNPLWQLRLAGSLVNCAPFALLGLALLQIAVELGPHDPLLQRRHRLCSQLAVIVALGFLLLVPLQGVAGLQQSRSSTNVESSRITGAERRLVALRQAVATASSNDEINQRLQRLQGPVLGPADIAQPLPLLKPQVGAVLDQAQLQIARERQATPPTNPWRLLPELLGNGIALLDVNVIIALLDSPT